MKITRQTPTELVVEENLMWLALLLAAIGLALLLVAASVGKGGAYFSAGFLLLCAVLCARKSRFVFDAAQRMVQWQNTVLLRTQTGSLPFDEIRGVAIDSTSSNRGGTTYRLTLLTSDKPVPVTPSYGPRRTKYETAREAILKLVQPGSDPSSGPTALSVVDLVRSGRTVDAIVLLRNTQGLSLSEARGRVDEIKRTL